MRILPFVILLFFTACISKSPADDQLAAIENIMDEYPDSALKTIEKLDTNLLTTDYSKALYRLLYSQALDKNYIDITNDSLIAPADEYFSKTDDNYHKMLALFYHGRIYQNAKDYQSAIISLNLAYFYAEEIKEYYWAGRVARSLSEISNANFNGTDAIRFADLSYENFVKSGNKKFINWAILDMANAHNNSWSDSIGMLYAKIAMDSALSSRDTLLYNNSLSTYSKTMMGLKRYEEAIVLFDSIIAHQGKRPDILCLKGCAYSYINKNAEAEKVLEELGKNYTNNDIPLIIEVAKNKGDYKEEARALDSLYERLFYLHKSALNVGLAKSFDTVNKHIQDIKDKEIRNKEIQTYVITGLLLTAIITIILLLYLRKRSIDKAIEDNILRADNLQSILSSNSIEMELLRQNVKTLFKSNFSFIENLCHEMSVKKNQKQIKTQISKEINDLISQFNIGGSKFIEIEKFVNKYKPGLINNFKADFPNISNDDYRMFIFTLVGLSPATIAFLFMEDDMRKIYSRKDRLKNKIKSSKSEYAGRYLKELSS